MTSRTAVQSAWWGPQVCSRWIHLHHWLVQQLKERGWAWFAIIAYSSSLDSCPASSLAVLFTLFISHKVHTVQLPEDVASKFQELLQLLVLSMTQGQLWICGIGARQFCRKKTHKQLILIHSFWLALTSVLFCICIGGIVHEKFPTSNFSKWYKPWRLVSTGSTLLLRCWSLFQWLQSSRCAALPTKKQYICSQWRASCT